MLFQNVELPDGSEYQVATDDNSAVVKVKKEKVWLSIEMILWLHHKYVPQSDCEHVTLEMNEVSNLVGKLLTIADASFTDKQQRDGVKSLIKQVVWKWGKEPHLGATHEQLESILANSEEQAPTAVLKQAIEHYEE